MNKIDAISNIIKENWSNDEIVRVWNDYCDKHCCSDDMIFYMDSFNELFDGLKPIEIVEKVMYGDFRTDDDFFAFNGYGNIVSFNDVDDYGSFDMRYVAEYLVDMGDSDYTEVDNDELLDAFIIEYDWCNHYYFRNRDFEEIKSTFEIIMEEESFDLLMDNWDDLASSVDMWIETNEENEED